MKQKNLLGKKFEFNSIDCGSADVLKVLMVNHGFCYEKKVKDLENAFLGKISVQINIHFTQIEDDSKSLGCMFPNFLLTFQYFIQKIKIFYFSHYKGALL